MRLQETERAKEVMETKLAQKQKEQKSLREVPSHRGPGAFTKSSWRAMANNRSRSVDNGELRRSTEKLDEIIAEGGEAGER